MRSNESRGRCPTAHESELTAACNTDMRRFGRLSLSTDEKEYRDIEVACEGDPDKIRQHKPARRLGDAKEADKRRQYQYPQNNKPHEGHKVEPEIEEDYCPEEIENELYWL